LVTFDYGLEAEEFLDPGRGHGTLRAYRDHNLLNDPLVDPGQQDLTTHVNFTAIRMAGEHAGLHTELMDSQSSFLTRVATRIWPSSNESLWTAARVRQFQTLTHPQYLGRSFRTLVQRRSAG
jgi:SAM-dependent MidA family methyltransferase